MYLSKNTIIKCLIFIQLFAGIAQARPLPRVAVENPAYKDILDCKDNKDSLNSYVQQCNVSKDICTGCMIAATAAAAATAIFTLGMSFAAIGVVCAAPCGIAAGMCDIEGKLRDGYQACLKVNAGGADHHNARMARYQLTLEENAGKVNAEVDRHNAAIQAIAEYPKTVMDELYGYLKSQGIDSDSDEAKEFLAEKMSDLKATIEKALKEEKYKFNTYYYKTFMITFQQLGMHEPWKELDEECRSFWTVYPMAGQSHAPYTVNCVATKCLNNELFDKNVAGGQIPRCHCSAEGEAGCSK